MDNWALAHEWLATRAGSEKTYLVLADLLPEAELFCLTCSPSMRAELPRPLHTSFLDRSLLRERRALTLPSMPLAWRSLRRGRRFEGVITSSHCFARSFGTRRDGVLLDYCHTPARYLHFAHLDSRGMRLPGPIRRSLADLDRRLTSPRVNFACNSSAVAERIKSVYDADAVVMPPPVDIEFFRPSDAPVEEDYLLAYSRFVPYKRLDLAIDAAARVGQRIVVAGYGPMAKALSRRADELNGLLRLVVQPSDIELRNLIQRSSGVIFCAEEDFGMVPVEAQACGKPVLALGRGGSLDTVIHGVTGVLAPNQTVEDFASGILALRATTFDRHAIRRHACRFGIDSFRRRFSTWVEHVSATAGIAPPRLAPVSAFCGE